MDLCCSIYSFVKMVHAYKEVLFVRVDGKWKTVRILEFFTETHVPRFLNIIVNIISWMQQ